MALAGSIDTFPLGAAMGLLESTVARGVLRFGHGVDVELHADGGALVGWAPADADDPVDLVARVLDTPGARFTWDDTTEPVVSHPPRALTGLAADAEARVGEWREMREVAPTPAHRLALAPTGDPAGVALDARDWAVVCAAGAAASLREVAGRLGVSALEAHRAVRRLRDAGLVRVEAPAAALPSVAADPDATAASPAAGAPTGADPSEPPVAAGPLGRPLASAVEAASPVASADPDAAPGEPEAAEADADVDPVEALLAGIELPDPTPPVFVPKAASLLFRAVNTDPGMGRRDAPTPPGGTRLPAPPSGAPRPPASTPPSASASATGGGVALATRLGMPGPLDADTDTDPAEATAAGPAHVAVDALGDRGPWPSDQLAALVDQAHQETAAALASAEAAAAGIAALVDRQTAGAAHAPAAPADTAHGHLGGEAAGRPVERTSLLRFFTTPKA
ncbi:MAG TPA: hypothetical protein VFP61_09940 [Acidimicrobiales bacterium]|nr:hypothetical protein [Acidimicrobiales bacterium]